MSFPDERPTDPADGPPRQPEVRPGDEPLAAPTVPPVPPLAADPEPTLPAAGWPGDPAFPPPPPAAGPGDPAFPPPPPVAGPGDPAFPPIPVDRPADLGGPPPLPPVMGRADFAGEPPPVAGPASEPPRPEDASHEAGPVPGAVATDVLPPATPPAAPGKPARRHASFWRELPFLVVIALVLALVIKAFLVQAFYIPSGSMEQTLEIGDRVLVNKLVYRLRDIHRGEIIVFKGPPTWNPEVVIAKPTNPVQKVLRSIGSAVGVAPPGEKDFIKRVIGVGGDTVQCCDAQGRVMVNGHALNEPYVYQDNHDPFGPVKVPPGRLWVMGDHRGASYDSRGHRTDGDSGTIPVKDVVGRAFVIVWPPSHWGTLPVPSTFQQPGLAAGVMQGAPLELGVVGAVPLTLLRRRLRQRRRRRRATA